MRPILSIDTGREHSVNTESLGLRTIHTTFYPLGDDSSGLSDEPTPTSGVTLGNLIGRGGVADVFAAQQGSLQREVAVKRVRGDERDATRQAFLHEARITARLNHPNILPIHDLIFIDERPALLMKRVTGRAWDRCLEDSRDAGDADLAREVARLIEVCKAMAFAHSKGVLHLDLKPANVMIGAFGEVLVMDWGCAVLFDDGAWGEASELPKAESLNHPFGTPSFMAPELARGEGHLLGVHTDIYLLGAILHVLLTGNYLRGCTTVREMVEAAARGERLPLPSDAPAHLARLCRRATEPDITRRTSDLHAFQTGLQHWLDTRESRALTERALAVLRELERAETLTVTQRRDGIQLIGVFEQAGRSGAGLAEASDGERRLRSCLARAALTSGDPGLARSLAQPLPEELRDSIVESAQALQAQQSLLTARNRWVGEAIDNPQAEQSLRAVVEGQEAVLGLEHPHTLASVTDLACLLEAQGRYADAEHLLRPVIESRERRLGREHPATLQTASRLAALLRSQGRYAEAEPLALRALEHRERTLGLEHSLTLQSVNQLATLYMEQGRYEHAEPLFKRAVEAQSSSLGPLHADTLDSINNLAILYQEQGLYGQAETHHQDVLAGREKTLGELHPKTLISLNNLASTSFAQARFDEAARLYQRALDREERASRSPRPLTLALMTNLAACHLRLGRVDEAERLFREGLRAREESLRELHPDTLRNVHNLGSLCRQQGRHEEAEMYLRRAYEQRAQSLGPAHPHTLFSGNSLAQLYLEQGRPHEAEALSRPALETCRKTLGWAHPQTLDHAIVLVEALLLQESVDAARRVHDDAQREAREAALDAESPSPALAAKLEALERVLA